MADNPDRNAARPRPGANRPHRGRLTLALAAILAVLVALIGMWMAMDSGPFDTPGRPVAGPEAPAASVPPPPPAPVR